MADETEPGEAQWCRCDAFGIPHHPAVHVVAVEPEPPAGPEGKVVVCLNIVQFRTWCYENEADPRKNFAVTTCDGRLLFSPKVRDAKKDDIVWYGQWLDGRYALEVKWDVESRVRPASVREQTEGTTDE